MYNYQSDVSHTEPYYDVATDAAAAAAGDEETQKSWYNYFHNWRNTKWNGQHRLLPTTESPTISACTTATNLSSLDVPQTFGSVIINSRRMSILEENLRVAQPEIEPLHSNKTKEPNTTTTTTRQAKISISDSVYNETTIESDSDDQHIRLRHVIKQVIVAISVSLVSLVVGFVSAYTSPAESTMKSELKLNNESFSWICSLMPLSAVVGGLIGGSLIEIIGRKWTILVTDLLFVLCWMLTSVATNAWYLYASRTLAGLSVGIASLVLPVYLGETVQPEVRGTLGLLPTAFGNVGILLCYVAGSYMKWDHLAYLGAALPVPFLLLFFVIPESPRWYVNKGKSKKAEEALQWLRGNKTNITQEYDQLQKSQGTSSSGKELFNLSYLKPLLVTLGLMLFQQMSGINAVIFYGFSIFQMSGSTIDTGLCTIIIGIVNFASTFIATLLIDRLGRKILLYISSISMCITLGMLGTYFYLKDINVDVSNVGWLPLLSFVIYVLAFSLGFGPIPWLMMGEILPAKIRGPAASLATAFNWTCTFVVTKNFVYMIDTVGPYGTFWFFAVVVLISIVFIATCVPETRGQSLQDIERKFRRMSSVANLKPMPSMC